jgi:hypothetical protein
LGLQVQGGELVNPFPSAPGPQVVTKDPQVQGFQYEVAPYSGRAVSTQPAGSFDRGRLIRGWTPTRRLPWTPYSYPSVGREPQMFIPPDVPASPAVQGQGAHVGYRKAQLGRFAPGTSTAPLASSTTT